MLSGEQYIQHVERQGYALYKITKPYRVKVPYGESGPWRVCEFNTICDIQYLRCMRDNRPPGIGKFTRLVHAQRGTVMSDTVAEIKDMQMHINSLRGNVLVTGLGLGMVPHALTQIAHHSQRIKSITIIEIDIDVMNLVANFYRDLDKRIRILHADAYSWTPDRKFDSAWHDIWDDICADNLPLFSKIKRHYQRAMTEPGRQFCWGEYLARKM